MAPERKEKGNFNQKLPNKKTVKTLKTNHTEAYCYVQPFIFDLQNIRQK